MLNLNARHSHQTVYQGRCPDHVLYPSWKLGGTLEALLARLKPLSGVNIIQDFIVVHDVCVLQWKGCLSYAVANLACNSYEARDIRAATARLIASFPTNPFPGYYHIRRPCVASSLLHLLPRRPGGFCIKFDDHVLEYISTNWLGN